MGPGTDLKSSDFKQTGVALDKGEKRGNECFQSITNQSSICLKEGEKGDIMKINTTLSF